MFPELTWRSGTRRWSLQTWSCTPVTAKFSKAIAKKFRGCWLPCCAYCDNCFPGTALYTSQSTVRMDFCLISVNPQLARTELIRFNIVNIVATDAPCVARTSQSNSVKSPNCKKCPRISNQLSVHWNRHILLFMWKVSLRSSRSNTILHDSPYVNKEMAFYCSVFLFTKNQSRVHGKLYFSKCYP